MKMSKKFTEEQYHKVIEAWNLGDTYTESTKLVIDYISSQGNKIMFMGNEALALANPRTRELAHEQFVEEKEKRYQWMLKTDNGIVISQIKGYDGDFYLDDDPAEKTVFTEKEIENSPFKPEWFDKEEVR